MRKIILLQLLLVCKSVLYGQGWQELGTGSNALNAYNVITSICVDSGGIVYASGFTDAITPTGAHSYVEKWDGSTWSRVGPGSDSIIYKGISAMCIDAAHNVYVAAVYTDTTGDGFVAKWDGVSWSRVGSGVHALHINSYINSICIDKFGNLYAAGEFTDSAVFPNGHAYVAKWDGATWSELGTNSNALNADAMINSIIADTMGNIYAAGNFRSYPGGFAYVAKWNGTNWSELGSGSNALHANQPIWAITQDKAGNIYAGGYFTDPLGYSYVAQWNGLTWSELGVGSNALNPNYDILSICTDGNNNVYAAGDFRIGGKMYVAKWNGANWSELGTGSNALNANGDIFALCADAAFNIYAGGSFTDSTAGHGRNYVAKNNNPYVDIQTVYVDQVKVFPNPADDIINICISNEFINRQFFLFDALDRIVKLGIFHKKNNALNISDLSSGIYFLKLGNSDNECYKVIKK